MKYDTLIVDIGNTSIKFSLTDLKSKPEELNKTKDLHTITKLVKTNKIKNIIVSSVNPEKEKILKEEINEVNFIKISASLIKDIKFNYKPVENLGQDRIANAYGAFKEYGDSIIVDFGTAITVDIIENKTYSGGAILPGIDIMLNSLSLGTKLVKVRGFFPKKSLGNTTDESVFSAITNSIIGMIKEYRSEKKTLKLIFTGSYPELFLKFFPDALLDKLLTLKGLFYYGQLFL